MNNKVSAMLVVAILGIAGVAAVVLADQGGESDFIDYKSDVIIKDFEGRDVPVPTSLDGGIITVGRFSALRWLAYFPEEFEKIIMVDDTLNVNSQGSLDYSYAYGDLLSGVKTHSRDNMNDSERMVTLNPSLIIVDSHIYRDNKETCNDMSRLVPLAVVNALENLSVDGFWDENYDLVDEFVDQAILFGKLLDNEERANDIVSYFQETLDDIRNYCVGSSEHVTYVAGPICAGSNPLSTTFNPYLSQRLVGGVNVMGNQTDRISIKLDPEDVSVLEFDHMVIEPSTILLNKEGLNLLMNNKSQTVLVDINGRNSDGNPDNDVRMFIVLPSISHGVNPLCVLASAYHMASIEYGTLTVDDVRENANAMFEKFYGTERGGTVMAGLDEYFSGIKDEVHSDICTDLFTEVKVEKISYNGEEKYIFVKV